MAITQEKAESIAQAYADNGFKDMTAPLLAIGYAKSYAQTIGHKLYRNVKVIAAIAKIKEGLVKKTQTSLEDVEALYAHAYSEGDRRGQTGSMVGAATGIARLYGYDKDSGGGREQTVIIIGPKQAVKAIESQPVALDKQIEGD